MSGRVVSVGDLTPEQRRVHRVEHILRRDGGSPGSALDGLASIVEDETWRKVPASFDDPAPFKSFRAFVETPAPIGLGYSIRQLRALLQLQHPDEKNLASTRERMDCMREAVEKLLNEDIPAATAHGEIGRGRQRVDPINSKNQGGTSPDYVIARLKRDDPALAEQVVRGELSPNAAALKKGWRKPRIAISTPERTAESLRRHMPPEARQALARLLLEE